MRYVTRDRVVEIARRRAAGEIDEREALRLVEAASFEPRAAGRPAAPPVARTPADRTLDAEEQEWRDQGRL